MWVLIGEKVQGTTAMHWVIEKLSSFISSNIFGGKKNSYKREKRGEVDIKTQNHNNIGSGKEREKNRPYSIVDGGEKGGWTLIVEGWSQGFEQEIANQGKKKIVRKGRRRPRVGQHITASGKSRRNMTNFSRRCERGGQG